MKDSVTYNGCRRVSRRRPSSDVSRIRAEKLFSIQRFLSFKKKNKKFGIQRKMANNSNGQRKVDTERANALVYLP